MNVVVGDSVEPNRWKEVEEVERPDNLWVVGCLKVL